jgi:hypothetical protein
MDHATLVKIEIHREVLEMKHAQRSLYRYTQNVRQGGCCTVFTQRLYLPRIEVPRVAQLYRVINKTISLNECTVLTKNFLKFAPKAGCNTYLVAYLGKFGGSTSL